MRRFSWPMANLCATLLLLPQVIGAEGVESTPNPNHIFNAIHASMRQWGSSLHHNGMSFFLATVPEGTQLYHGDYSHEPVNGTEWLAFEPEHAMVFANPYPHGPPRGKDHKGNPENPMPERNDLSGDSEVVGGWLHTYTAAKDLRLLYLDGMSAGKTQNGTMDSQDRIIYRDQFSGHQENDRAKEFCRMAREDWEGRLDGVLRMEAGFEIILCDFARDLNEVRVTQVKRKSKDTAGPPVPGKGRGKGPLDGATGWIRAVASRYNGIGGNRVILNYDNFVTAYVYGLDLFRSPDGDLLELPRLAHLSSEDLEPIRTDVHRLIMEYEPKVAVTNWQAIADMVVERYAHELRYLASGQLLTIEELQGEIEGILGPFIDASNRNASLETARCASQFLPAGVPTDGLAGGAVHSVAHSICATLTEISNQTDYDAALTQLQHLMGYLSWTTWKECGGCADNEVCVVPMWPMGTVEDYKQPRCRNADKPNGEGRGYWGNPRGPPGPPPSWMQRMSDSLQTILW